MMDAGSYCAHVSRTLAAAAGAPGPLVVTSAAAKMRPGSSTVDGRCGTALRGRVAWGYGLGNEKEGGNDKR
jgi:hypothetical protein